MTPIQRAPRYNLLLNDAAKNYKKAGQIDKLATIQGPLDLAHEICEYANDMMIAGRMSGFSVIYKKKQWC
jgi:hypothetical protein